VVGGDKKVKITATITLLNDSDTDVAGPVTLDLFASSDATLSESSDPSLGRLTKTQKLKSGATSKPVKVKLVIPAVDADGDFRVFARATGAGAGSTPAVAESATQLRIERPVVDVAPTAPALAPVSFKAGKPGTLSIPLRNAGNTMAKGSLAADLFFTTDGTAGTSLGQSSAVVKVGLKPGASKATKVKVATTGIAPGSYVLLVRLTASGSLGAPNLSDGVELTVPVTIA
jgi:hypothetical protein